MPLDYKKIYLDFLLGFITAIDAPKNSQSKSYFYKI